VLFTKKLIYAIIPAQGADSGYRLTHSRLCIRWLFYLTTVDLAVSPLTTLTEPSQPNAHTGGAQAAGDVA